MNNCRQKRILFCMLAAAFLCATGQASDMAAIGDSMMKSVGRAIRKQSASQNISVEVLTSIGSGLARLDLLDWHVKAAALMAEQHPSMVFVMMGANDNQPMQVGGGDFSFDSAGWTAEYGRRVGKLMDILIEGGAKRVVWIGLPTMREPKLNADVQVLERIVIQQANTREKVDYFSSAGLLSPDAGYKAYIILTNGMPLDVRAEDGIHLNRDGAEYLARLLLEKFKIGDLR